MQYDVVHASVNFENDFVCKTLNKSELSCLLEMVLSIITELSNSRSEKKKYQERNYNYIIESLTRKAQKENL